MKPKEARAGLAQPENPRLLSARPLSVGLIGCGAIGSRITEVITRKEAEKEAGGETERELAGIRLTGIYDPLVPHPDLGQESLQDLINLKPDVIIEAAGHQALQESMSEVLGAGIDLMILSVGALCNDELYAELESLTTAQETAQKTAQKIGRENIGTPIITSGAIGGMDIIQTLKTAGEISEASITSTKPLQNFLTADLPQEKLDALKALQNKPAEKAETMEVFSGSVKAAALAFPQSANVCATLGFATLGIHQAQARLIADSKTEQVTHKVYLRSELGEYEITLRNRPFKQNPKTSEIVAYAVLRALISRNALSAARGAVPGIAGGAGLLQII